MVSCRVNALQTSGAGFDVMSYVPGAVGDLCPVFSCWVWGERPMKVPGLHSYYENISFTMPPLWEVGTKRQPFRRFRGSGT